MDRFDPTNFDFLAHERRTTVRGLGVEHFPNGENLHALGHEFKLAFDVGPNTQYTLSANAAELRRWSMILAEAVLRLGEPLPGALPDDAPRCPACGGDVHIDLAGAVWSTTAAAADRARALHRPIPTYQHEARCPDLGDEEHCEAHHHENVGEAWNYYCDLLPDAKVCSECLDEEGERVEYPCPTIRAMDGEGA